MVGFRHHAGDTGSANAWKKIHLFVTVEALERPQGWPAYPKRSASGCVIQPLSGRWPRSCGGS